MRWRCWTCRMLIWTPLARSGLPCVRHAARAKYQRPGGALREASPLRACRDDYLKKQMLTLLAFIRMTPLLAEHREWPPFGSDTSANILVVRCCNSQRRATTSSWSNAQVSGASFPRCCLPSYQDLLTPPYNGRAGGTGQIMSRLKANEIDVAIALTESLIAGIAKQTAEFKLVGTYVTSPLNWAVIVGKESKYQKLEDLRGEKIGVSRIGRCVRGGHTAMCEV